MAEFSSGCSITLERQMVCPGDTLDLSLKSRLPDRPGQKSWLERKMVSYKVRLPVSPHLTPTYPP